MKNIPLFTTQSGIASLILEQIPFNKTAYIRIQSSMDLEIFLQECVVFCRAVGAEKIYAAGEGLTEKDGPCASVIRMVRERTGIPEGTLNLIPLNREHLEIFRSIYNRTMCKIPNASGMSVQDIEGIYEDGSGYLVYQFEEMVGIGIANGEWIHTIISLKKGMGEAIMRTLISALAGVWVRVELIDSNLPAKTLYERMGFSVYETVSKWHRIF